ncbi:MAG TPA: glucose PTS transporter subunit EIIB [Nocardioidaceae bacterium]|nr:glucose PTS transporter subunit EIIB [Nocardioidaceae bacterium]
MRQAELILAGLGGSANVVEIEPCITRLRTAVQDVSLIDESALNRAGAHGVLTAGSVVQVVVGPEANLVASEIETMLG